MPNLRLTAIEVGAIRQLLEGAERNPGRGPRGPVEIVGKCPAVEPGKLISAADVAATVRNLRS